MITYLAEDNRSEVMIQTFIFNDIKLFKVSQICDTLMKYNMKVPTCFSHN